MDKKTKKYNKTLVVPIEPETWKMLYDISYHHHISMAEIARQGVQKMIKKFQKNVD